MTSGNNKKISKKSAYVSIRQLGNAIGVALVYPDRFIIFIDLHK
jgi:hypothetical protein